MNTTLMLTMAANESQETISAVTLSSSINPITKILLFVAMSSLGSVGNIFLISSIMIQYQLNFNANAFIANIALADILITLILIPSSIVVILSKNDDHLATCRFQLFLVSVTFVVTVQTMVTMAIENCLRIRKPSLGLFSNRAITVLMIVIWLLAVIVAGLQSTTVNYCCRLPTDFTNPTVSYAIAIISTILCTAFFTYLYTFWFWKKRKRAEARDCTKAISTATTQSQSDEAHLTVILTNFLSLIVFVIFWLPFTIIILLNIYRPISLRSYYNAIWFAFLKSCLNHAIYGAFNRHFRTAFFGLFDYCCCKSSTAIEKTRPYRYSECGSGTGANGLNAGGGSGGTGDGSSGSGRPTPKKDVRVHIIAGYNRWSSGGGHSRDNRKNHSSYSTSTPG